jgi:O-acetyl-ADP-ribose deacetylase (regulator of RNase III)
MKKFGNKIPTGNVVATNGGSLPCKKVIHAVGPLYTKKGFECPLLFKRVVGNSFRVVSIMKMNTIAMPALCSNLYQFPTSIVARLILDEILHYNHHDFKKQIKEFTLIDINETRSKILAKELDKRDFVEGGGLRKSILDEQDKMLSNDLRVLIMEEGEGEPIKKGS